MLRKETVSTETLDILKQLMLDERLKDFFLVGGTALSLQIGHRISIDIDLFSMADFDANDLLSYLETKKELQLDFISKNTIKGVIANVKVDLITHAYPLVNDLINIEGIRMASTADIAAMKLNAIMGNGTRLKDFIDIAFLSTSLTLHQMVEAYRIKYNSRNPLITIKALSYHQDINFNEPIKLISGKYTWKAIESRLNKMIKFPDKLFPAIL